jgi:hypothetical protein
MLGLGALLALEITTSTPDALCPPLEEARAAVRTRVGEVRGPYQAEFSLVRADDGQQSLELVVREADVVRLRRTLSLEGVGCDDAAQAIALVLERYFDTVEKPARPVEPKPAPVPVSVEPAPSHHASSQTAAATSAQPRDATPSPASQRPRFELRSGIQYDLELSLGATLGASYVPNSWRIGSRSAVGLSLDGTAFLSRVSETVREQQISASTWQAAFSLPLLFDWSPWMLGLGPWAQLRLQRAEAPTLKDNDVATRALFGVGGSLRAAWWFHRDWALATQLALGGQFSGLASRFVLRQEDLGPEPVLVPQSWFGQAQLAVQLSL